MNKEPDQRQASAQEREAFWYRLYHFLNQRWAAQERVPSQYHLYRFLIINGALWLLWLLDYLWARWQLTSIMGSAETALKGFVSVVGGSDVKTFIPIPFPWPLYVTIIWGIFILLDYLKKQAEDQEHTKTKQKDREDDSA